MANSRSKSAVVAQLDQAAVARATFFQTGLEFHRCRVMFRLNRTSSIFHNEFVAGRVRLVPKASSETADYIEIEGPPDLIVEIVSDSSVCKDTKRLPAAYFAAGVPEFWLVDARRRSWCFAFIGAAKGHLCARRAGWRDISGQSVHWPAFQPRTPGAMCSEHWQFDLLHAE